MTIEKIRTIGLISYRLGVVGFLAIIAFNNSVTVKGYVDVNNVLGTVDVEGSVYVEGSVDVDSISGTVDVRTSYPDTVAVDGSVDVEGKIGGYPIAVKER